MLKYATLFLVAALVAAITSPVASPGRQPALTADGLPTSYAVPVSFGDLGPRLVDQGVIDPVAFTAATTGGRALANEEQAVLEGTFDGEFVVDAASADFLLNFLWAVGLANTNPILTSGPMVSGGDVGRFASTGGWTVGARPIEQLYASLPLVTLSPDQQARLERVAGAVSRPCCNNPTSFPDCNHGMAMLALLTLMASTDASVDAMFDAARWVSALWFPSQAAMVSAYTVHVEGRDWATGDPQSLLSAERFSASGQGTITEALASLGEHLAPAGTGGGCSVG